MIRDLSKYARRLALGAMAALALIAGSANQAHAQYNNGTDAKMSELGIDSKAGDYLKGVAASYIVYQFVANVIVNPVADCERRRKGIAGANLGPQASQPSLLDIFFNDGRVDADQAAYKKTPAALVTCDKATVATKAEMQDERFRLAGIDPTRAAFTGQSVDLGQIKRDELTAQYAQAISDPRFVNYASAASH